MPNGKSNCKRNKEIHMNESRFFKKVLTPAEVGNTGTHEKYIRLTNDFDFESFFQQEGEIIGSVRQILFEAKDLSVGHENDGPISFKFVYYENSNKEKRLPSLGTLYNSHNIQEGDVIILESKTSNGNTEFFFSHLKAGQIILNPATIYYTEITTDCKHDIFSKDVVLQQIYYGAPGTGKSHRIKKELKEMNVPNENIFRTTFHPDSDYSSFVGAYKPTMKPVDDKYKAVVGKDEEIAYSFVPQTFIKAYTHAYKNPDENIYLIIEEINRGNCAQIFGDLFQLLDRDENGGSEYPIKADSDLKMYLEGELGVGHNGIKDGELCLPSNLYIWATMNTSDQSLFPIDSAFKRRWDWEYEPIKYKNTDWLIKIGDNTYKWTSFQRIINDKIFEATNSEDKMLGDYFVKPCNNVISEKQFINKVLFYLWNDVCKDGDGDIFRTEDNKDVKFSDLYNEYGTNTLQTMMKYLGVKPISEDFEDDEKENGENEENDGLTIKYSINGEKTNEKNKAWGKGELVKHAVEIYCDNHPQDTAAQIRDAWMSVGFLIPHIVETDEDKAIRLANSNDLRSETRSKEIKLSNGESLHISTQVGDDKHRKGFSDFLSKIEARPEWGIIIQKL